MRKTLLAILAIALILAACPNKQPSNPIENRPPDTHLFLVIGDSLGVPDTSATPDTSASMLVLHWYGDDPDGEVIGYQWAWDDTSGDSSWTFTELVMDTFYVKIREAFNYFTFYIRAMDSDSALDPSPARITFPIINSPPSVRLPVSLINDYATEHNITLGYHTFTWSGSDPDGSETISGYQMALADTSFHWDPDTTVNDTIRFADLDWSIALDSLTFSHTFSGLEPGCYRVFLRAFDIAGAYSRVVYYPETTGVWEVIPANGRILYIDDNVYFFQTERIYKDVLDSLNYAYTFLEFEDRPFYYAQDIQASFELFDIIIYNAGSTHHLRETGPSLTTFVNNGGNLMTNITYSSGDTVIYPFMPVDSVYEEDIFRPIYFFVPESGDTLDAYPDTLSTGTVLSHSFAFAPAEPEGLNLSGYKVLYVTSGDTVAVRYPYNPGLPEQEPARVILFSFPVFDCNVNGHFTEMYVNILRDEFGYVE